MGRQASKGIYSTAQTLGIEPSHDLLANRHHRMAFGRTIIARSVSHESLWFGTNSQIAKSLTITTMSSDTTTTTTNNNCRLLALPAELRNRIWEYTMIGGKFLLSSHPNIHIHSPPLTILCTLTNHSLSPSQTAAASTWTTSPSGPPSSLPRASTSP
jgi:hypothetical protein